VSVALTPDGTSLYAANELAHHVSIIDTHTGTVTATVSLGGPGTDPFSAAATANAIYVAEQGANALAVIDPRTLKVLTTIPVGSSPYGGAASPTAGG
jgi:YVTN family beta-propeller protein